MREKGILTVRCPRCEKTAKRKNGWFAVNAKRYLSIYCCEEHGYLKGKIRIKSTDEKKYYLMKTVELTDKKEVKRVQDKQEALRMKRRKKKSEK